MKRLPVALMTLAICVLALPSIFVAHNQERAAASQNLPSEAKFHKGARSIPGQYIVTYNDDMNRAQIDSTSKALANLHGGRILYIYEDAIKGFAVQMSEKDAIALSQDPRVTSVAEDGYTTVTGVQSTPQGPTTFWGLDRLDQRNLPLDNTYHYNRVGTSVHAYVLDTGIWVTHDDYGGRAHTVGGSGGGGFDAFGGDGIDRNNHGTLVTGVLGGKTYGVAKNVQLHAVKVCNDAGNCPDSSVVAGINWVINNRISPAVINLSIGGPTSMSSTFQSVNNAVNNAIANGITCVIGAGNGNTNASTYYPAQVAAAITVGASTRTDTKASYSNFGAGLDVFAPGGDAPDHYIPSTGSGWLYGGANNVGDGAVGTSMAAPHVTGAVAQYLQVNRSASPAVVAAAIIGNATNGVIANPVGSPNRLLYSHFLAPGDNRADFDGDFKSDVSVFNRTTGLWSSLNSSNGSVVNVYFGTSGDIATPGDYDGDGKTDRAIFRPSTGYWWTENSSNGATQAIQFGVNGDIPVARDYDADGRTDRAVFRPSTGYWWIWASSNNAISATQFGLSGDHVVAGDYDGDDKADIAVFRPSSALWYILRSSDGAVQIEWFGLGTDWPVQADYDGDGKTDIAIFRTSTNFWWIKYSSNGSVPATQWGASGDRPVPADYDGDGKADVAIQRPDATGAWYVLNSSGGSTGTAFSSEFPVQGGYLTPLY
jgi:subtilisin family serine protease